MSDLQATVEFSIELHKFYNVDLFQRGFYQVRTCLKVSPKLSVKIEVNLSKNQKSEHLFSPFVTNDYGVSRIFQILYRNQEVLLDNVILFRVHLLVDCYKIEETLERADFTLNVELWYTEQPYLMSQQNGNCVSVRTLHFHFSPIKGLHYHLPVLFDYFHLAAVTITIHAILVALHQPFIKKSILHYMQSCSSHSTRAFFGTPYSLHSNQTTSLDTLFLGNALNSKGIAGGIKLELAKHVHEEVCSILSTTYDTLQSHLEDYMKLLPAWQQTKLETNVCLESWGRPYSAIKVIKPEDDFITVSNTNIAQLCAKNILLWQQFLDAFTCKIPILQHLAKYHHQLRVKRFSEAFFVIDNPRQSAAGCFDANYQNYVSVTETVRRSKYLASLPTLPVTCSELDGDTTTIPIIFEDQYKNVVEFAKRRNDASKKSGCDSFLNSISESRATRSVLTGECNCGIFEILESRSVTKVSSRSTLTGLKNFNSFEANEKTSGKNSKLGVTSFEKKKSLTPASFRLLGKEVKRPKPIADDGVERCQIYKTASGGEYGGRAQPISPRRHSKSLDQLKKPGNSGKPACRSDSIVRSTSFHMPFATFSVAKKKKEDAISGTAAAAAATTVEERKKKHPVLGRAEVDGKKLKLSLSETNRFCDDAAFKYHARSFDRKIKSCESAAVSVPDVNGDFFNKKLFFDRFETRVKSLSESMPNLMPIFSDSLIKSTHRPNSSGLFDEGGKKVAHKVGDSSILNESRGVQSSDFNEKSPEESPASPATSSSSSSSSASDDAISEPNASISDFFSHSETEPSTGVSSPEAPMRGRILTERVLKDDALIERLKKLAVSADESPPPPPELNGKIDEDIQLSPPYQFRDVPSPPEHFRDPPKEDLPSRNEWIRRMLKSRQNSVDDLWHRLYDIKTENKWTRKEEKLKNGATVNFDCERPKEKAHRKNSKKRKDESKGKKYGRRNEDAIPDLFSPLGEKKLRLAGRPNIKLFSGHLFEEDLEDALRKTAYEREKRESASREGKSQEAASESSGKIVGKNSEESEGAFCSRHSGNQRKKKKSEDDCATFARAKEEFKKQMNFSGMIYSDFSSFASTLPYFHISDEYRIFSPEGVHLIVCVHGLDGNSNDLRLVKTYVELGLPGANLEFLMSERNQGDTFSDFETMTDKLVAEILGHIEACGPVPSKISFIGHSLGNIIIRSAITRPQMKHLLPRFHTFLSLSGPHLGTLYNNSGLVNMGMWFMQKWKKSGSLLQLSLKDAADVRQTFLYRLSRKSNLHLFRHVLLCGSSQDRYVPMHSARIELCKAAVKDNSLQGIVYREMVHNIINPVINCSETTLVRYDVHHALPSTANSLIGRAAHIAVLDSELFIEKFLVVAGLKYFR